MSKLNRTSPQKQFKFAITVMTLLGVAWIFGFFLIIRGSNTIWLRWLFIVFNSTQVHLVSFPLLYFPLFQVLISSIDYHFHSRSVITFQPQGISIFILYVVLNDNLKKVWRKLLNISDSDKPSHSSVPYSRSKGNGSRGVTSRGATSRGVTSSDVT